ncbi:MAG: PaaI family thioesterase [Oceanicaulis sp.]|uniref:PaaI family thioesterase n=1 Tax=Glycocaulis sp. TaxID=1969725 RepID=UPI0025BC90BE|nr:PaaI family thioesterase [Glycocaulis sp.]MCC5982471.1 PaaI family thioesterase [Oceanicaulis sp.]MCH8521173.1 PaaI family thioesterase [Glycocaulis sp.]
MSTPSLEQINAVSAGKLPGLIGLEITSSDPARVLGHIDVREELLAPNGFLHAASVIGLVDSLCGYGAMANLPDGAVSFTTVELKSNFLGTARDGRVLGEAVPVHLGRNTQVWDAKAWREADGKPVALFRCTQMVLYAR